MLANTGRSGAPLATLHVVAGALQFGVAAALGLATTHAVAQERTGQAIVESSCATCHRTGQDGAPRIGDRDAWSRRASQGLTSLTDHAVNGIRRMPPHGGNSGLSDREIRRAITYMVNESGGSWVEPIDRSRMPAQRSGPDIVRAQCGKCHDAGTGGAPRVGDQSAWIPRVREGLDTLVRSAINGHGGMPARGGMADLTDTEIRAAIVYMFNAGVPAAAARPAAPVSAGQDVRIVDGTTVHLGVVPAKALRSQPGALPPGVAGSLPPGPDQYYVTVALFDANSGQRVTNAAVRARISSSSGSGPEKALEPVTIGSAQTYGNFFAMAGPGRYTVAVSIRRAGAADAVRTQFHYSHQ